MYKTCAPRTGVKFGQRESATLVRLPDMEVRRLFRAPGFRARLVLLLEIQASGGYRNTAVTEVSGRGPDRRGLVSKFRRVQDYSVPRRSQPVHSACAWGGANHLDPRPYTERGVACVRATPTSVTACGDVLDGEEAEAPRLRSPPAPHAIAACTACTNACLLGTND